MQQKHNISAYVALLGVLIGLLGGWVNVNTRITALEARGQARDENYTEIRTDIGQINSKIDHLLEMSGKYQK